MCIPMCRTESSGSAFEKSTFGLDSVDDGDSEEASTGPIAVGLVAVAPDAVFSVESSLSEGAVGPTVLGGGNGTREVLSPEASSLGGGGASREEDDDVRASCVEATFPRASSLEAGG